jgi:hypothetical protein
LGVVLTAGFFACEGAVGQPDASKTVAPDDFQYLGAFRLPVGGERPETFAYGGAAATFRPDGDSDGPKDGFPGSLFIMGHDRLAYGELPNGNQIAEMDIPVPVISKDPRALPEARLLQPLRDAARGLFGEYDEIPRVGMQYLKMPGAGAKIHLAWGQHFHEDAADRGPTHGWIEPDLSRPQARGFWHMGNESPYAVNGYLFEIPAAWADRHAGGRCLATGRYRDGGWSGMGPALFAYRPWTDANGTPAADGARLEVTPLLRYEDSRNSEDVTAKALKGYQHADEWEGGAWLTTTTGKTAVLFAGTKGVGSKYWYGWANPAGSDYPCVETELLGQFTLCRLANGAPAPAEDLKGCEGHNDYRGWWSAAFRAEFILYNPDDLARVAAGKMQPWEPQPYATLSIDDRLLLNPSHTEEDMLGRGVQRRYRIGEVAYDREHDLLYVLELFADEARPVVHVWRIS